MFDFNLNNPEGAGFQSGQHNNTQGTYTGLNYIVPDYTGDWIILKFPSSIILTKFIFKERSTLLSRSPAEWKVYGSNNGINFIEIIQASQTTKLLSSDYINGFTPKLLVIQHFINI